MTRREAAQQKTQADAALHLAKLELQRTKKAKKRMPPHEWQALINRVENARLAAAKAALAVAEFPKPPRRLYINDMFRSVASRLLAPAMYSSILKAAESEVESFLAAQARGS